MNTAENHNPNTQQTVVTPQQGGALIMKIGEPTGERREAIERQLAEAVAQSQDAHLQDVKQQLITQCIMDFDVPVDRYEKAKGVIEAVLQNGHSLGMEASGTGSVAHIAASVPDVAMFLALYNAGAPMNEANSDGATPAHVVALRMVMELEEGKKAALTLHRMGISFCRSQDPDVKPAISILEEWPTFAQQWRGWKALNGRKEGGASLGKVALFLALWKHRRDMKEARAFLYELG